MKTLNQNVIRRTEKQIPENKAGKLNTLKKLVATRWKLFTPLALAFVLYACNNNQLVQQYKTLHDHDSILMAKTQADDSTIRGYVSNLNDIQSNLDAIKTREKILTVRDENKSGNSAVNDIKSLDTLIIKSNREIANLRYRIKKANAKDAQLEAMVNRLTAQVAQQDSEIATLQNSLAKVNASYAEVTRQFNDSITVLQTQNNRVQNMTTQINTVYYAVGTEKELKKKNVITQSGGFIGIGKNSELTPDRDMGYFTKTDLTKLDVIPLNAKFKKLLTTQPAGSYKITGNKVADSLVITNKPAFWSEAKYLVIAVK